MTIQATTSSHKAPPAGLSENKSVHFDWNNAQVSTKTGQQSLREFLKTAPDAANLMKSVGAMARNDMTNML
ncbi:MAG: hypothetical protein V4636_01365 [Pseudomonadota bacterium]